MERFRRVNSESKCNGKWGRAGQYHALNSFDSQQQSKARELKRVVDPKLEKGSHLFGLKKSSPTRFSSRLAAPRKHFPVGMRPS
uniref:Uncharacterized protein n=1 Tax=Solanum lycopersicum TaxID=4081 RepID=A0A3Q7FGY9_SOLLC